MKRHAYLILAHNNFDVLRACLRMIDDQRNDVYILFDKKSCVGCDVQKSLAAEVKKSKLVFVEPISVFWADFSLIEATMRLLKTACDNGVYSYLHYMQGADLPIKSQDEIHSFFADQQGKEFVHIDFNETMADFKCKFHHLFTHNRFFRHNKLVKLFNYGVVFVERAFRITRNDDLKLFHGSALFSITSEFARYLIERIPEIKRRFKHTLACDEVFVQSLIMASPFKDKMYRDAEGNPSNARLINWTLPRERNSPHVWDVGDKDIIVSQPRHICFARKFSENKIEVVTYIESIILNT